MDFINSEVFFWDDFAVGDWNVRVHAVGHGPVEEVVPFWSVRLESFSAMFFQAISKVLRLKSEGVWGRLQHEHDVPLVRWPLLGQIIAPEGSLVKENGIESIDAVFPKVRPERWSWWNNLVIDDVKNSTCCWWRSSSSRGSCSPRRAFGRNRTRTLYFHRPRSNTANISRFVLLKDLSLISELTNYKVYKRYEYLLLYLPDCFVDPKSSEITRHKYTSEPNTSTINTSFIEFLTIGMVVNMISPGPCVQVKCCCMYATFLTGRRAFKRGGIGRERHRCQCWN